MKNDHAIVVRADARAMGAVSAFRVGGTRANPRVTAPDLTSDVVSIFPDGSRIPFVATGRTRARGGARKYRNVAPRSTRISAADLAPIGDSNH